MTRGLAAGLTASLVYYIAYPSYYILGGATGIALAYLIRQRRMRAEEKQAKLRAGPQSRIGGRSPLNLRPHNPPGSRVR
jgi:hypothetical protein